MSRDLKKFLTTMHIPSLSDPNFIQDFNQWANAISENFEKIISAPYLKGDKGNSIETITIDVAKQSISPDIPRDTYNQYGLREAIINKINDFFGGDCENDAVVSINSSDSLSSVIAFKDDVEGKIYISNAYNFIDGRLSEISASIYDENFTDKTISITGIGVLDDTSNSYVWTLELRHIIPTLYYDNDLSYWCWCVNGEKTGIIAQGVSGESGKNAAVNIVSGHLGTGEQSGKLYIDYQFIGQYNEQGELSKWVDPNDPEWNLCEGDIVICFNTGSTPQNPNESTSGFLGISFGVAHISIDVDDSLYYWTAYDSNTDIMKSVSNLRLREMLNNIGIPNPNSGVVAMDAVERGLYIPKYRPTPSSDGHMEPQDVHMLWTDVGFQLDPNGNPIISYAILNLGETDYQQTCSNGPVTPHDVIEPSDESQGDGPSLKIHYNTETLGSVQVRDHAIIRKNLSVSGDSRVSGDAQFEQNVNIQQKLTVGDGADITGDSSVTGNLSIKSSTSGYGGNLLVEKNLSVHNDAEIDGNITGHKTLSLDGVVGSEYEQQNTLDGDSGFGLAALFDVDLQDTNHMFTMVDTSIPGTTLHTVVSKFSTVANITISLGAIGYAGRLIGGWSTEKKFWNPMMFNVIQYTKPVYLNSDLVEVVADASLPPSGPGRVIRSHNITTATFKIKRDSNTIYNVSISFVDKIVVDKNSSNEVRACHYISISNATIEAVNVPEYNGNFRYKLSILTEGYGADASNNNNLIPSDNVSGVVFWENQSRVPALPHPVHNVVILRGRVGSTKSQATDEIISQKIQTKLFMELAEYIMLDGNVNGYYTESPNTYMVLKDDGWVSIDQSHKFLQTTYTNYQIPNLRIFPKGIVGYQQSNYTTQLIFPDEKYYNGGMWLDLSKGIWQKIITELGININNSLINGFSWNNNYDWHIFLYPVNASITPTPGLSNSSIKITYDFNFPTSSNPNNNFQSSNNYGNAAGYNPTTSIITSGSSHATLVVDKLDESATNLRDAPCVELVMHYNTTQQGHFGEITMDIIDRTQSQVAEYSNIDSLNIVVTKNEEGDPDILDDEVKMVVARTKNVSITDLSTNWSLWDGNEMLYQEASPQNQQLDSQTTAKGIAYIYNINESSFNLKTRLVES